MTTTKETEMDRGETAEKSSQRYFLGNDLTF